MKFPLLFFALLLVPTFASALDQPLPESTYVRAKVTSVTNLDSSTQQVTLTLLEGVQADQQITIQNGILNNRDDMRLAAGEKVVLQQFQRVGEAPEYQFREKYRLPSLYVLTLIFFGLGVLFGGRTGFTSILGLAASIGIIVLFVVPKIVNGHDPLFVSLVGAAAIACTSLYLAHGCNRRTSIALVSTIITLVCSVFLALVFVHVSNLFGMGSEESVFLQLGVLQQVNLKGLLLGGIIIGALGVLDDITTAQTAAIDELSKANHSLGFRELYQAGTSIGREHIASLINSLALAYAGASMPLLLLFYVDTDSPWWVILNSEFLAEEIIRTLVGSSTLVLAVPISTWLAAKAFAHGNHTTAKGHVCMH